ncbi:MAG: DUF4388 domain-containing protein [Syntrophobacteraceae bacterium]|nr:DUF4388 domain-containing protein [Syntrophobacteraceae bacterium]
MINRIRLLDLVQLSCLARMSHNVRVDSPHKSGFIVVDSGTVIHAETGSQEGEGAFCEILSWESGNFRTLPLPEEKTTSINKSWEYLLIEAMRYASERAASGRNDGSPLPSGGESGFFGVVEDIPLTDLVQLACMARMDRVILLDGEASTGKLVVQDGQVCHAQTWNLTGEDAFCQLLKVPGGRFETLPLEDDVELTIAKPWEYLLIDAMRFVDEQSGHPDEETAESEENKSESLFQRLMRLKVSEKIRMAMMGDKDARVVLIRDSNRMVQLAIINNPRITEGEVTSIAYSRNVDEEVLRRIANNREWTKLYQVRAALVKNPKTPLAISMKMVQTLPLQDLKEISKSKSVPAAVANAAKRHAMQKP